MKNNRSLNKTILSIPIPVLLISSASLLQMINVSLVDLYYYLAVLLAFGIGVTHVFVTDKFPDMVLNGSIPSGLWLPVLILVFSAVLIAIIYYYTGLNIQFMTFIISFIIPHLCVGAYRYFLQMV